MRIAHINFLPSQGVSNKLESLAMSSKELNLPIEVIIISREKSGIQTDLKIQNLNLPTNILKQKWLLNFKRYSIIQKAIDLSVYDRIIIRYPGAMDFSFYRFFRQNSGKIITEYHSDPIAELKVIKVGILNPMRIAFERYNSPKLLNKTIGFISVTEELRQKYERMSSRKIPSVVVSNGVDVVRTSFTRSAAFKGDELNMIFVSSRFYPWHGLDRLLDGLQKYEGRIPINLFLIGRLTYAVDQDRIKSFHNPRVKIIKTGFLSGDDLDSYFRKSHLAVSSLAIFRNNMSQACVLKTREYAARGIPFIYAYDDVDLSGKEEFALKLSCDDTPVNVNDILSFAFQVSKMKHISEEMRRFAELKLDWKKKIMDMYRFVTKL